MADYNGDGLDDLTHVPVGGDAAAPFLGGGGGPPFLSGVGNFSGGGSSPAFTPSASRAARNTSKGLPGLPSGAGAILAGYGINSNALSQGSFANSGQASPDDFVQVGKRALGIVGTVGDYVNPHLGATKYSDAQNLPGFWYNNDQNFYKQFVAKAIMYKVPGANSDMGLPEAGAIWDNLLQQSIQLGKSTGRDWTPWQVLETYNHKPGSLGTHKEGDWIIDNATGEKVKYVGPRSKTTTQTRVDLTDPETAQALITQSLTQLLGRAPSDGELAQFKGTISGYEKAHPTVATTTENINSMGETTSSNTTTSGGVTDAARQQLLQSGVEKGPEYAKYQGGTTYFNALLQLIGGG